MRWRRRWRPGLHRHRRRRLHGGLALRLGFQLSQRLCLFGLLLQIEILLIDNGLLASLFRLFPRLFPLLPVNLPHLIHLRLMLLLIALLLLELQLPLFRHLMLLNLLRRWLSQRQRAADRYQQRRNLKQWSHAI